MKNIAELISCELVKAAVSIIGQEDLLPVLPHNTLLQLLWGWVLGRVLLVKRFIIHD